MLKKIKQFGKKKTARKTIKTIVDDKVERLIFQDTFKTKSPVKNSLWFSCIFLYTFPSWFKVCL